MIVSDFRFLAGTVGTMAADRIVHAVRRATRQGLPILASPVSGGTRMQEGTAAFVRMIDIAAAIVAQKGQGLAYLVYLRNPTTGGALASWGSLGHFTFAQPGALVGFLGPRVFEALKGRRFPEGVQRAENLEQLGIIDGVLDPQHLAGTVDRLLSILGSIPRASIRQEGEREDAMRECDAWDSILRTRKLGRPGVREILEASADAIVTLRGTEDGRDDPALFVAIARIAGMPCVVLGHDRESERDGLALGPDGLRLARRRMALAAELRIPLLTIIDTAGAALSAEAENGGLSGEIARSIADLVTLPVPTASAIIGQGAGGGALAMLPADRIVVAENGWLSSLPPEGASVIVHRSPDHADTVAAGQGVSACDLRHNSIVDRVVPEGVDAADEPREFCERIAAAIGEELSFVAVQDPLTRESMRQRRYGQPHDASSIDDS